MTFKLHITSATHFVPNPPGQTMPIKLIPLDKWSSTNLVPMDKWSPWTNGPHGQMVPNQFGPRISGSLQPVLLDKPNILGTICLGGPSRLGTICPWGPKFWGPSVHGDQSIRDQISRDHMRHSHITSQTNWSILNFRLPLKLNMVLTPLLLVMRVVSLPISKTIRYVYIFCFFIFLRQQCYFVSKIVLTFWEKNVF